MRPSPAHAARAHADGEQHPSDEATRPGAQAIAVADTAHRLPSLRTLSLVGSHIGSAGGAALAAAMRAEGFPPLTALQLGYNPIVGSAARALAEAVFDMPSILDFSGIPLGRLRAGALPPVAPLTERERMRRPAYEDGEAELQLQGHGFGVPGARVLVRFLPDFPRLRAICVPYQALGSEGAEIIAEGAARAGLNLEFLMLSRNDVGGGAAERIGEMFPRLDEYHLRMNDGGTC